MMRRRSRRPTMLIATLVLAASGCTGALGLGVRGSGQEAAESRDVAAFERIVVTGQTDVTVARGDTAVTVRGDDNLLSDVVTEVNDGTLRISERRALDPRAGLLVEVTAPRLDGAAVQGSGDFTANDVTDGAFTATVSGSGNLTVAGITGDMLTVGASGSGNLTAEDVDTQRVTADVEGSGDLRISGAAQQVGLTVSGSGVADLDGLAASQVTVVASGSGDANVRASDVLDATASGSGNVNYAGDPVTVRERSTGSGDVQPR
jgi:hypothetical protein